MTTVIALYKFGNNVFDASIQKLLAIASFVWIFMN